MTIRFTGGSWQHGSDSRAAREPPNCAQPWKTQEAIMKTSTRLYAWLKFLTMLHIVEQLIFGMEDLHQLQRLLVGYENWFGNTNTAIAALVTINLSLAVLAIRCILKGGPARFVAM